MGFWDWLTTRLFTRFYVCDWQETDPTERMLGCGGASGRVTVPARSFCEAKAKADAIARPVCKGRPLIKVRRAFHWETNGETAETGD